MSGHWWWDHPCCCQQSELLIHMYSVFKAVTTSCSWPYLIRAVCSHKIQLRICPIFSFSNDPDTILRSYQCPAHLTMQLPDKAPKSFYAIKFWIIPIGWWNSLCPYIILKYLSALGLVPLCIVQLHFLFFQLFLLCSSVKFPSFVTISFNMQICIFFMFIYILKIKCQTARLLYSCIFKNQYYLFLLILLTTLPFINFTNIPTCSFGSKFFIIYSP